MPVIAIFGAGAVGSLFAHVISEKEINEVHIVARHDHVVAIREHGLIVHEYDGTIVTNFNILPHETLDDCPRPDVAFVTAKTYQIPEIVQALDARYGGTMPPIVLLMNGLGLVDMARQAVPGGTFIRGIALTPAHFEPGEVWSTGGNLRYTFPSEQENLLASLFSSNVNVVFADNFEEEEWRKTLINAVMNPVAGILGGAVGPVLETPFLFGIVKGLISEFRDVALARSIDLGSFEDMVAYCLSIASKDPEHAPSLSQDLQRGKKTEIDAINGYIVNEGRRLGVPTPLHEALITLVKFLEHRPRESA